MNIELADLQTPALLIDLDKVRRNIARTLQILGGQPSRWRPHIKTSKIPEVMDLLFSAQVEHFKCATTKEASCLLSRAEHTIDLLVCMAHQAANLSRVAILAAKYPSHRVSLLSEDPEHARSIREASPKIGIFIDLNPGYDRSGIELQENARILATIQAAGDALRGLHFYDGHLHGGTRAEREESCAQIYGQLLTLHAELDLPHLEIITSGTPTFVIAAEFPGFRGLEHRVSPGTVVYWDLTSDGLEIDGYQHAATVLSTVISRPAPGRLTFDAGSKALDAAIGDPCCSVLGWPDLIPLRPSEEHLPVSGTGQLPELGSRQQLVPRHVCPTVNLADEAVLLENGAIKAIVPVAARGHETLMNHPG